MSDRIKPIVKWVGGKSWLVDELMARLPATFGCYYEPFAGGGALLLALSSDYTKTIWSVLGDSNPDLLAMYQSVADDVETVIILLKVHKRMHCRRWYEATREMFNAHKHGSSVERSAAVIYLTRTGFNGLWRVNGAGEHNVPMGRYKDPLICPEDDLRRSAPVLSRTALRCGDYRTTVADAASGDVVFIDPPYDTADDGFTSFTTGPFGRTQQLELAKFATKLRDRGVFVMLTNADTPRIRKFYTGWQIDKVYRSGAINSKTSDRGKVAEVIITPKR